MTKTPPAALHMGSGEPVLLLQPFLLSAHAWRRTAEFLAESHEVFVPTFAGHWGGPSIDSWKVDVPTLADVVEAQLDELGWETCHIVGNSLGGWVAFELEQRGRARTVTAVAPAGGWHRHSLPKFEVGLKFLSLAPLIGLGNRLGNLVAENKLIQRAVLPLVSKNTKAVSSDDAADLIRAGTHCAAYLPVIWSGISRGGIHDLSEIETPVRLVLCENDRIVPISRFAGRFVDELPAHADRITLRDIGHCPQLEDPALIAQLIGEHVASYQPVRKAV
ncbi:alpha/beta hydrolase [Antrihabitans stalactiti]